MRIRLLMFTLVLIIMFSGTALANDRYYWITSDNQEGYFFDTETLAFTKNDNGKVNPSITDAWLKVFYTPDGVRTVQEAVKPLGYTAEKLRTLHYALQHVQINTTTNQLRISEQKFYNKNGNVLLEIKPTSAEWVTIAPDSRYAAVKKTIESYTFTYYDIVYNRGN